MGGRLTRGARKVEGKVSAMRKDMVAELRRAPPSFPLVLSGHAASLTSY